MTEIMDQTPDAGIGDVWAGEKSLGKRDRDEPDALKNKPAPARLLCESNQEAESASPAKPKDLNQDFQKEKDSQAADGDAKSISLLLRKNDLCCSETTIPSRWYSARTHPLKGSAAKFLDFRGGGDASLDNALSGEGYAARLSQFHPSPATRHILHLRL